MGREKTASVIALVMARLALGVRASKMFESCSTGTYLKLAQKNSKPPNSFSFQSLKKMARSQLFNKMSVFKIANSFACSTIFQ